MTAVTRLALAIPTFCRSEILRDNLLLMRPELASLRVPVHILDDSPDDATQEMVAQLMAANDIDLRYRRNTPSLGHDRNIVASLLAPDADYVWLLGDAMRAQPGALTRIHSLLSGQDFIFLHRKPKDELTPRPIPPEALREHLAHGGWSLSMTGATIYARRVTDWLREQPSPAACRNFPQLAAILGFARAHADARATFVTEHVLSAHPAKQAGYWLANTVTVFARDWLALVTTYSDYFGELLPGVLRSHSVETGILGLNNLLELRGRGFYSAAVFAQNRDAMLRTSAAPPVLQHLVARLPQPLMAALLRVYIKLFGRR